MTILQERKCKNKWDQWGPSSELWSHFPKVPALSGFRTDRTARNRESCRREVGRISATVFCAALQRFNRRIDQAESEQSFIPIKGDALRAQIAQHGVKPLRQVLPCLPHGRFQSEPVVVHRRHPCSEQRFQRHTYSNHERCGAADPDQANNNVAEGAPRARLRLPVRPFIQHRVISLRSVRQDLEAML